MAACLPSHQRQGAPVIGEWVQQGAGESYMIPRAASVFPVACLSRRLGGGWAVFVSWAALDVGESLALDPCTLEEAKRVAERLLVALGWQPQ